MEAYSNKSTLETCIELHNPSLSFLFGTDFDIFFIGTGLREWLVLFSHRIIRYIFV